MYVSDNVIKKKQIHEYVICLYVRLSIEDDDVLNSSYKNMSENNEKQLSKERIPYLVKTIGKTTYLVTCHYPYPAMPDRYPAC